jgi:hypothetical protein
MHRKIIAKIGHPKPGKSKVVSYCGVAVGYRVRFERHADATPLHIIIFCKSVCLLLSFPLLPTAREIAGSKGSE